MGRYLGELIDAHMNAKKLSAREVARNSGGLVSYTTISNARSGDPIKKFENRTLLALATALGLPPQDVLDAYEKDAAEMRPSVPRALLAEAELLSAAGRKALRAHLEFLLETERQAARRATKRGRPKQDS